MGKTNIYGLTIEKIWAKKPINLLTQEKLATFIGFGLYTILNLGKEAYKSPHPHNTFIYFSIFKINFAKDFFFSTF